MLFRAITVALVGMTAACSMQRPSEIWTDHALEAHRLEDDDQIEAAEARYLELQATAPNARTRRWITYELAEIAHEDGRTALALERYASLWDEPVIDEYGANALNAAASIHDVRGDHDQAMRLRYRALLHYPNEMGGEVALDAILDAYQNAGLRETRAFVLERLYALLSHTFLADNLLYIRAQDLDAQGDPDRALTYYRRIAVDHPDEMLADDALWEMANIYRRHQRWQPAIHNLKIIANNTETSWFVGDYNSQWVDDAIFDLGMIHLLHLKDYNKAVEYFERFVDDYEFSLRADDALWHACEARRFQGEDAVHLQMLKKFLKRFPESRYAERARSRLGVAQ